MTISQPKRRGLKMQYANMYGYKNIILKIYIDVR